MGIYNGQEWSTGLADKLVAGFNYLPCPLNNGRMEKG